MDAKLESSQACYKRNFNRTVWNIPQFQSGQYVFIDRSRAQMTESACMANAPLTELKSWTLCPFEIISTTPDAVTLDENGIHNTVSVHRAAFAPVIVQKKDGTDQTVDSSGKHKTTADWRDNQQWRRTNNRQISSATYCATCQNRK